MASLSKTTYLMGLQCPKLLWYRYNAREEIPEADEAQQAIFDQGQEVGALAKKLFPKGIEIAEGIVELDQVAQRTQSFLKKLKHPLSFLDFETFGTAIPMFDDSKPYSQVPFQFSLHVAAKAGAKPEHRSFLAGDASDPRPDFVRELVEKLPPTGSIVAYNASFEIARLKECCELLPQYATWLENVQERIVDLLDPFRAFDYYHPDQGGSASLKAVLPVLTGSGYEKLTIQEGGAAGREFLRVTFGEVPKGERAKIQKQLEEYCGLDTLGMVNIVKALATSR